MLPFATVIVHNRIPQANFFSNISQKMGIGYVVRDHNGDFLAGLRSSMAFASQHIIAECREPCGEQWNYVIS